MKFDRIFFQLMIILVFLLYKTNEFNLTPKNQELFVINI